jgi:hypothetical protein
MQIIKETILISVLFCSFVTPALGQQSARVSTAFSGLLERQASTRSNLDIRVTLKDTNIRRKQLLLANGPTQVSSLPVVIENKSSSAITTTIDHEWYGGLWPPTDLYLAVKVEREGFSWREAPGYLIGELGSITAPILIRPGESAALDIRLNWPGTGSIRADPLIRETKPGQYTVKLLLLFKAEGSQEFVETPEMKVGLSNAPR